MNTPAVLPPEKRTLDRCLLWIDQVGAFLLCLADEVTIGGPVTDLPAADISLLANLSRRHATIARSGERYVIRAHAGTLVADLPVHERTNLCDGQDLRLGDSVRLRFRIPNAKSGTARLDFGSSHRPRQTVNAIVLMHDTCLLGPSHDNHIVCPGWTNSILLYRTEGRLWCRSVEELAFNGVASRDDTPLEDGTTVTGTNLCFRLEAVA